MRPPHPRRSLAAGLGLLAIAAAVAWTSAVPVIQPNDNTKPAGRLSGDTLHLRLVVQMANWYPEADTGPVLSVAAFGEEGVAPRIPAPLIRVREGTTIAATIRNALSDSSITVFGLGPHAGKRDSVILSPGESRALTFPAGAAGTYHYRARIGKPSRTVERDQNGGAFIVDPASNTPPDRVFVINIWGELVDSATYSNTLTINGRSWPWTERIQAIVGDTVRWRVVNPTGRPHPMHLHGAFFRVDSKGYAFGDTTYTPEQRRLVVTEDLHPGQTMKIAWAPVHEGRWLFHCHITFHVTAMAARIVPVLHYGHDDEATNPAKHMAGLVMGIDARQPDGATQAARLRPRRIDLYVQEGPRRARSDRTLSFLLQRGPSQPGLDSTELPGSLLLLTRDEPTDITVHNRLKEATAVHWHGLELESFSDGVAGWGGTAAATTPPVRAGGTFTARLTTPRAGTFIYHTHLRDEEQLSSGLYGPIVVLEPGQTFDSRKDHVHIVGWDGMKDPQLLINGDSLVSPPIQMRVGESHRLRFINIGLAEPAYFTIRRDTLLADWTPLAKDGAYLPVSQRTTRKAQLLIDVGHTYDFEFIPTVPGEYVLSTPSGRKDRKWIRRFIVR